MTKGWYLFENGMLIWVNGCNKREKMALERENGKILRKVRDY